MYVVFPTQCPSNVLLPASTLHENTPSDDVTTDLVWVARHVVVAHEAGDELAEQEVVRLIERAQTPVSVVVGVGAEAEGTLCEAKHRLRAHDDKLSLNKLLETSDLLLHGWGYTVVTY